MYKIGYLRSKGSTVSASGFTATVVLGATIKLFNFKKKYFLKPE